MTESDAVATPQAKGRLGLAITLALLAVVLGVAAFGGYRLLSSQRDAVQRISSATTSLEEVDLLVARIDAVVGAQVRSGLTTRVVEAQGLVEEARDGLGGALGNLGDSQKGLRSDDVERARLLREAIEARVEMLEQAPPILETLSKAERALPKAESAWARVVEADGLAVRAVREYNKLTKGGVQESTRLNKRAATELAAAREEFLAAESAFPEARVEVYVAYVDARIALNKLSQRSDAAWLSGDLVEANRIIDSYNTGDKRAIAQAKELPSSSASVIAAAYDEMTKIAREKYYAARERATQADVRLKGM